MKIAGIIIAKENSNRFPRKNYHVFNGKPMFLHNVELLRKSDYIKSDSIYVATDSENIKKICKDNGIYVIHRGPNISIDEQPFFDVLKYAYMTINKQYDIIVSILANTINHELFSVNESIKKMVENENVHEIRSFDDKGNQSGIIALRENIILEDNKISNQMAMVKSNGREIHRLEELQ